MKLIKTIYKNFMIWFISFLIKYMVPENNHLMFKWIELKAGFITESELDFWMHEQAKEEIKIDGQQTSKKE